MSDSATPEGSPSGSPMPGILQARTLEISTPKQSHMMPSLQLLHFNSLQSGHYWSLPFFYSKTLPLLCLNFYQNKSIFCFIHHIFNVMFITCLKSLISAFKVRCKLRFTVKLSDLYNSCVLLYF